MCGTCGKWMDLRLIAGNGRKPWEPECGMKQGYSGFGWQFPTVSCEKMMEVLGSCRNVLFFPASGYRIRFPEISIVFLGSRCRSFLYVFRFRPYSDGIRMVPEVVFVGYSGFPFHIRLVSVGFPGFFRVVE